MIGDDDPSTWTAPESGVYAFGAQPSRWAAFSDDELNRIARGLLSLEFHALHTSEPARIEPQGLRDEITAEIERRKT